MKKQILLVCLVIWEATSLIAQVKEYSIITTDIENFFIAYDSIQNTTDSIERLSIVNELYINKGTEGLKALMSARHYTAQEYVDAFIQYPNYWNSIRDNADLLNKSSTEIENYIQKLQSLYLDFQPADIYFSVGVFRSAGTYDGKKVLFGAEFLLANENSVTEELPEHIRIGIQENAPFDIPLMSLHEYIHTQQKRWENKSILHLCVAEGVAEFVSTKLSESQLSPPVKFGKENSEIVLTTFMNEVFRDEDVWNWLWNKNQNHLKERDLGYYIGYEICERYYNQATDKGKAIYDLINLNYDDDLEFARMVDASGFLPMTIQDIGRKYDSIRPIVKRIIEFENGSNKVTSQLSVITIEFSDEMSPCCRSFDFIDSNEAQSLKIKNIIGWSTDYKQFSFEVENLEPNTDYGLIISNFAKSDGLNRILPFTIRFKTDKTKNRKK